jgi:hypothetical protein
MSGRNGWLARARNGGLAIDGLGGHGGRLRAGRDLLELDGRFGEPGSEVGDQVGDRPIWITVVARSDDLSWIERLDEPE